jgi:hypothetical protein
MCFRTLEYILLLQYSETKVMHFLLNLLRIKGLYMFRVLLAHPQEALKKQHLVYCVHVMSVGSTRIGHYNPGAVLIYYDAWSTKYVEDNVIDKLFILRVACQIQQ